MADDLQDLPQALHRFLELFNREEYWESHEVLEGPWRDEGSDFYQGLILYASAFVHAQRGNPRGVGAQLVKTERKLGGYRPCYLGIDVDAVLAHSARCRELVELRRDEEDPRSDPSSWLEVVDVPRLELHRRLVRGDEPELRPLPDPR
jgi:predicted metal-dependent hydrolase